MVTKSYGGQSCCSTSRKNPSNIVPQGDEINISGMQSGCQGKSNWISGEKPPHSLPELAENLSAHIHAWSEQEKKENPVSKVKHPENLNRQFSVVVTNPSGRNNVIGPFRVAKYAVEACERFLRTAQSIGFVLIPKVGCKS